MKKLTLYFIEEVYGNRLTEYIRRHYQEEFFVTQLQGGDIGVEENSFLLTDDWELYCKYSGKDAMYFDFQNHGEGINPYQSCEEIIRFLLWNQESTYKKIRNSIAHLNIFYTPGGSSTQWMAAIKQAESMGKQGSCLYIPIKEFCMLEEAETTYDLSELCYLIRKGEELTVEKIEASTVKEEFYSALWGLRSPIHLIEMGDEICQIIQFIIVNCSYEYIVIDMQFLVPDFQNIFNMAEKIYSVEDGTQQQERSNALQKTAWEQLEKWWEPAEEKCKLWKWGDEITNEEGE